MTTVFDGFGPGIQQVLAPNAGPMTLDGTNSWIVGDPGRRPVIVDPGPLDEDHLKRLLAAAGGSASAVWLTHRHHDHSEGAVRMAEMAGCRVWAMDPAQASGPAEVLGEGSEQMAGPARLIACSTPGHTSDSLCYVVLRDAGNAMLTGDTILGRGTTVIAHPDGDFGAYLESLDRLLALVEYHRIVRMFPGHGQSITDPAGVLERYRRHRLQRLDQVRAAVAAGDRTAADVVNRVYDQIDPSVRPAAEQSVRAQLEYLGHPG